MMKLSGLVLVAVLLVSCGSNEVGQGEIDKAYPQVSQSQLEADLAREGKLDEYKAIQQRNADVEAGQVGQQ